MSLWPRRAAPHRRNSPRTPSSHCWWWRLAGGGCGNSCQRAKVARRRSLKRGARPRGPSQDRGWCSSHQHAPGWRSPWCAGRHSGGLGKWKGEGDLDWFKLLESHTGPLPLNSNTHLSHIRRWTCVPACCCWHTRNDPCGRPAPPAPWCRPLHPPPPPPPAGEPSPSATSAWTGRQTPLHCHGNAAPASPSWERLCVARRGRWLARTTLEQSTYNSMVDVCCGPGCYF